MHQSLKCAKNLQDNRCKKWCKVRNPQSKQPLKQLLMLGRNGKCSISLVPKLSLIFGALNSVAFAKNISIYMYFHLVNLFIFSKEFPSGAALRQHELTHDNTNGHTCSFCNRTFRYPSQLRDHIVTHSNTRPYMCTECGMDFMKVCYIFKNLFLKFWCAAKSCVPCIRTVSLTYLFNACAWPKAAFLFQFFSFLFFFIYWFIFKSYIFYHLFSGW